MGFPEIGLNRDFTLDPTTRLPRKVLETPYTYLEIVDRKTSEFRDSQRHKVEA